ncbi:hypothetical protein TTHERM_00323010 (macronuclear) [Tetrahymena thermophila SB210]|uniref:Uncharacterized protein n=1 Tax=Tetrahymena thermophila (strain SB210) TaxID=312017 RepID=Q237I4_TETTS|nr:hypothetical protein TTHERM_00323010 [Tetrahymena thermophila SB210]EAR92757.1 hypothetical protein TTHERM_00323010 [Tetrahymena thermophila SB210]|eukprot:XP_001013002.1 hypothetical protein TTHERM_00323010 [Tetrahymena thermophila SB210]
MRTVKVQPQPYHKYSLLNFKSYISQKGCCRNQIGDFKKYQQITLNSIQDFIMTLAVNQDIIISKTEDIKEVTGEQLLKNLNNLIPRDQFSRSLKTVYIYKHKEQFRLKGENIMAYQLYASKIQLRDIESELSSSKSHQIQSKEQNVIQKIENSQEDSILSQTKNKKYIQQQIGIYTTNSINGSNIFAYENLIKKQKLEQQSDIQSQQQQQEEYQSQNNSQQKSQSQKQEDEQQEITFSEDNSEVVYIENTSTCNHEQSNLSDEQELEIEEKSNNFFNQNYLSQSNQIVMFNNQSSLGKTFLLSISNYHNIIDEKLKKGYQTYYHLKQRTNDINLIYISIFTLKDDQLVTNPNWKQFRQHLVDAIQKKFRLDDYQNYYYCKIGFTKNIERVDVHFKNFYAKFYKAFLCYRECEEQQFHQSQEAKNFKIPVVSPISYDGKAELYIFHPLLELILQQKFRKYKYQIL